MSHDVRASSTAMTQRDEVKDTAAARQPDSQPVPLLLTPVSGNADILSLDTPAPRRLNADQRPPEIRKADVINTDLPLPVFITYDCCRVTSGMSESKLSPSYDHLML